MEKTLFRPVTVVLALNNVFETILASQLMSYFQNIFCYFLSDCQLIGDIIAVKLHSCVLWRTEKKNREKGECVAIVTMDLSKAFDSLSHLLLIKKLQAYGLDYRSCFFLLDYLQKRLQQVQVLDTEKLN